MGSDISLSCPPALMLWKVLCDHEHRKQCDVMFGPCKLNTLEWTSTFIPSGSLAVEETPGS